MFENYHEPLLSRKRFVSRLGRTFLLVMSIIFLSMICGTLGFRIFAGDSWDSSFHHACLVLGDQQPEHYPDTAAGKIFSGVYVMYARLVFLSAVALLFLPVLHRILHKLHLDTPGTASDDSAEL